MDSDQNTNQKDKSLKFCLKLSAWGWLVFLMSFPFGRVLQMILFSFGFYYVGIIIGGIIGSMLQFSALFSAITSYSTTKNSIEKSSHASIICFISISLFFLIIIAGLMNWL